MIFHPSRATGVKAGASFKRMAILGLVIVFAVGGLLGSLIGLDDFFLGGTIILGILFFIYRGKSGSIK